MLPAAQGQDSPEFLEMRYGRAARMLVAGVMFLRLAFWLGIVLTIYRRRRRDRHDEGMKTVTIASA